MNMHFLKKLSLSVVALLVTSTIGAKLVTETEARMIALNFKGGPYTRGTVTEPQLVRVGGRMDATITPAPTYYIYNYGTDDGFIIVSGDDCLPAVLAFSEKGTFAADGNMPPQVESWLKDYTFAIQNARVGGDLVPLPPPTLDEEITIDVQPLIKSRWDQVAPYNEQCPVLVATERAATGCAATAIAQIMKYHNWPDCGEGSNKHLGYTVDFSQSVYDWAHMCDTYAEGNYTETEAQAVAKLMKDIGYAVWMQYSDVSAAQNAHIYRALYTHFKYSQNAKYVLRNTMTTDEWKQLIRTELENGRPVYYAALSEDQLMGHAFVCDGIDHTGNYFHFNWGWSGNCDGFYYLHTLNPPNPGIGGGEGNFNADHTAIIGIEPAGENEVGTDMDIPVLALLQSYRTSTAETSLGKVFKTTVARVWNFGPGHSSAFLAAGLFKEGKLMRTVSEVTPMSIDEFAGVSNVVLQVTIPKETISGDYELRLVTSVDGVNDWEELPVYHDAWCRYIGFTIDSDRVMIHQQSESGLTFEAVPQDITPVRLMPRSLYQTKFKIENTSDKNFSGSMCWRIKKLVSPVGMPPYFLPQKEDTIMVVQTEWNESLYGGEMVGKLIEYSLDEVGDYLLEICYKDPLNLKFEIVNVWPLKVEGPIARYGRMAVAELAVSDTSDKDNFCAWAQGKEDVVAVAVDGNWRDSIGWVSEKNVLFNRIQGATMETLDEVWDKLKGVSSVADVQMEISFVDELREDIRLAVHTTFAHTADKVDMRLGVLVLQSENGIWHIRACCPAESFKGQSGRIPSTVEAGRPYTYEVTTGKQIASLDGEILFMAVLTDATTGEIVNAALSARESLTGNVSPQSLSLEYVEAYMNIGMEIPLKVSFSPLWATTDWIWSSSNPDVATVDDAGIVNSLAEGTTEIRVSASNVSASLIVHVMKMDVERELQVMPGCLHHFINESNCPSMLTLSGELNATDVALLRRLSQGKEGKLRTLDISRCQIVSSNGIEDGLFKDCSGLTKLILPEGMVSIGDNAFMGCTNLQTITIPETVQAVGYAAFAGCNSLQSFVVSEGNSSFKAIDGVLYNYTGTELVAYPAGNEHKHYVAIETLNTIRPFAFYQASHLISFTGNLRLSTIGYAAFYQCESLQSVELDKRVARVDEYAFADCPSLSRIFCSKNNPPVCVADNVFDNIPVESVHIFVPEDYIKDYRLTSGWRLFSHYADVADEVKAVLSDESGHVWLKTDGCGRVCAVSNVAGLPVTVYDSGGAMIYQTWTTVGEKLLILSRPGIYLINMQGLQAKVMVR